MTEEDLKAMKLHEIREILTSNKLCVYVTRVINGWVYLYGNYESFTSTFVPEVLPIKEQTLPRLP